MCGYLRILNYGSKTFYNFFHVCYPVSTKSSSRYKIFIKSQSKFVQSLSNPYGFLSLTCTISDGVFCGDDKNIVFEWKHWKDVFKVSLIVFTFRENTDFCFRQWNPLPCLISPAMSSFYSFLSVFSQGMGWVCQNRWVQGYLYCVG